MRRISYILLLGILLSACQKNTKSKGTNLPVEVISPIKKTETGRSREYTFLSRPYNETVLSFRINGPVLNFDLRPGQAFSKGSTILSIDNRDFLIRKQQTEALYSQTNQEYQRLKRHPSVRPLRRIYPKYPYRTFPRRESDRADPYLHRTGQAQDRDLYTRGSRLTLI